MPPMFDKKTGKYGTGFAFALRNQGLASAGVEDFHIYMRRGTFIFFDLGDLILRRNGPEFPATIPANDSLSWHYDLDHLGYGEHDQITDPDAIYQHFRRKAKLVVFLGNGKKATKTYRNRGIGERIERWVERLGPRLDAWMERIDNLDTYEKRLPQRPPKPDDVTK